MEHIWPVLLILAVMAVCGFLGGLMVGTFVMAIFMVIAIILLFAADSAMVNLFGPIHGLWIPIAAFFVPGAIGLVVKSIKEAG